MGVETLIVDAHVAAVEEDVPRETRAVGEGGRGPVEGRRSGARQSSIDRRTESAVIHNTLQFLHVRYPPVAVAGMPAQAVANARTLRVSRTRGRFVPVAFVVQRGKKRRKQTAVRRSPSATPRVNVPDVMDTSRGVFLLPHQFGVVVRKRPIPVIRVTQGRTGHAVAGEDDEIRLTGGKIRLTGRQASITRSEASVTGR